MKKAVKKILTSHTVKNGMFFTLYSFINSGFSFILLLILAKYISPDDYGQLNLFTVFIQVLTIFVCLGTQGYVSVSFFRGGNEKFKSVLSLVFIISTIMVVLYLVSILIFPSWFEKILGLNFKYLFIAVVVCYFQVFNHQCFEMLRINEYVGKYGILSISQAFISFVLSLLLVVTFHKGWVGRIYTTLIVAILYMCISVCYFLKNKLVKFEFPTKDICHETIKFGLPLLPHHAGVWVRQSFDRFVINSYHTSALVGLYSFASNFSNILVMIGTAFNAVNSVQIYKELANGYLSSKSRLDKVIRYTCVVFFALALLIVIGCYIFIPLLFPNYSGSCKYLVPLVLSAFFQCIYLLYVNYLFFYKKTVVLMNITVTLSFLQLLLSLIFTKFDVMFAALINMTINGLICMSVIIYKKKLCKIEEAKETSN